MSSPAPVRSSARRAEPGRSGLLFHAIDCFARHGYAGASIDRIARAAGVTKGAVYYHFRDKQQLLFASVKDCISTFESAVMARVERLDDPRDALAEVATMCADIARDDNHRRFILTLMVEALDTHPELEAEFQAMMQRFRAFQAHLIRRGQQQRLFRAAVNPDAAAEAFVAGILGAELQYYQDSKAVDVRRTVAVQVEQTLAWLAHPDRSKGRQRSHGGS